MKIERFEEIEAWQKARQLAGDLYRWSKSGAISRDFSFRDQIRRAAVSVMANIAEGFGRRSNKDFANFLYISKGSANEVISHLYLALDQQFLDKASFEAFKDGYQSVIKMLIGFIRYLESKPGSRF